MMTFQTFDNIALGLAVLAVLLRMLDYPRGSAIASSLTVLFGSIGQWLAHRRQTDRELAEARSARARWPRPPAVAEEAP
jgi:hypothetical protein